MAASRVLPVSVVASVVSYLFQHASATTVYGLGGAGFKNGDTLSAIAAIDVQSGAATWTKNFTIPYGASFCPGGFAIDKSSKPAYYSVSEEYVTGFDVNTGNQDSSVKVSIQGYDLVDAGYNPISGLLWGIGGIGEANFDFITVNASSGQVRVVDKNIPYGSLSSCEGAAVPAPPAQTGAGGSKASACGDAILDASAPAKAGGAVYFVTQSSSSDTDELVRFDVTNRTWSKPVTYGKDATIWSVAGWYPVPAAAGDRDGLVAATADDFRASNGTIADEALILVDGPNATTVLVSVNTRECKTTLLMTLDDRYSAQQSAFTFDPASGIAYAIIQGPASLVTYSILSVDLTVSPPKATYAHIPDSYSSQFGIADVALAGK